jgi:hypothetical protein
MGRKKEPLSKRSQGIDRHVMPRLSFHLPQEQLARLRAFAAAQEFPPTDAVVLRAALDVFLASKGYPPAPIISADY